MKIKQSIVMIVALIMTISAQAQSLEEGIKMYKFERYKSAKQQLSSLAGSSAEANYYLGLSELQLGNTDAAKNIFAKYPEDYANISGMARVAFATGNVATGNQIAEDLAKKAKKKDVTPYRYAADAITYTKGGDKQKAIEWYNLFLERQILPEVQIALADAYQDVQGGGGKAMTNYETVVANNPKNSLALSRIGKLWYDAKRYDLALENWQKAQEADATNPLPYRDLANAYRLTGKYALAKENVEKYWQYSDKSNLDKEQFMDILFLSEDYNGAITKAKELISAGVVEPRFYGILAFSQLEIEDSINALKNIRKYVAGTPQDKIRSVTYLKYGSIMLMNSMSDSADFYFTKYAKSDTAKDKSDSYRNIAQAFKGQKAYEQTARWYEKLVTEFPNDAKATDFFYGGLYYYYSQGYEKADELFALMETNYPDQPSAPYWRGRANAAIDNEAEKGLAVPHYEKWLDLKADDIGAPTILTSNTKITTKNSDGTTRTTEVGSATTIDDGTRNNKNPDRPKDKDLMQAYQYLLLYYFKKDDNPNTDKYLTLVEWVEPDNKLSEQIRNIRKG